MTEVSLETMQVKRQWSDTGKLLKGKIKLLTQNSILSENTFQKQRQINNIFMHMKASRIHQQTYPTENVSVQVGRI